jgi:hypothetical protein
MSYPLVGVILVIGALVVAWLVIGVFGLLGDFDDHERGPD